MGWGGGGAPCRFTTHVASCILRYNQDPDCPSLTRLHCVTPLWPCPRPRPHPSCPASTHLASVPTLVIHEYYTTEVTLCSLVRWAFFSFSIISSKCIHSNSFLEICTAFHRKLVHSPPHLWAVFPPGTFLCLPALSTTPSSPPSAEARPALCLEPLCSSLSSVLLTPSRCPLAGRRQRSCPTYLSTPSI